MADGVKFFNIFEIVSLILLSIVGRGVLNYPPIIVVCLFLLSSEFLHHIVCRSVVWCIHIYNRIAMSMS